MAITALGRERCGFGIVLSYIAIIDALYRTADNAGHSADLFHLNRFTQRRLTMRRIVTSSILASVVLLAGTVCLAQEKKSDAAGAKADSPEMWEAYKKMWEGKWETTVPMPNGGELKGVATIEVILDGHAVLVTRNWSTGQNAFHEKALGSWCPKRKVIVLDVCDSAGGRAESIVKLVDGEEQNSISRTALDGTEESTRTIVTVTDKDTYQLKITEGRYAGAEVTWKRKKD
jgi:hypothetical protein